MEAIWQIKISNERAAAVYQDLARGSEPELRFYTMVAASSLLATLGLIMNSTAVVIGAMLVAPLMTPIFGISLALVRGDASLLGKAVRAEIIGVFLAIFLSLCLGFFMPELEVTQEMLSRTKPNLLDLLVAVFAGFAGAYAMVDEHISPALPGVAIATAIVPPLANTGLCISLGAYHGALGSFTLFFANFLSILLVASAIFFASGMERKLGSMSSKDLFRRFGLAAIGFLFVASFLGKGLYDMVQERQLRGTIRSVLSEELSHLPASELEKVVYREHKNKIYCLAHVFASGYISPYRVKSMEKALEDRLDVPVELFVRSTLSADISSTGSTNQVVTETLDGFFIGHDSDPNIKLLKTAEQTIREYLETQPSQYLEQINLLPGSGEKIILATLMGLRSMQSKEIERLESEINIRTGDEKVSLVVRHMNLDLYDRFGPLFYEWMSLEKITAKQKMIVKNLIAFIESDFKNSEYTLTNTFWTFRNEVYYILIEVVGNKLYSKEELDELRRRLAAISEEEIKIYIRSKPEVVITESGYTSFNKLQTEFLEQGEFMYKGELKHLIEGTL